MVDYIEVIQYIYWVNVRVKKHEKKIYMEYFTKHNPPPQLLKLSQTHWVSMQHCKVAQSVLQYLKFHFILSFKFI